MRAEPNVLELARTLLRELPAPVEVADFNTERFIVSLDPEQVASCDRATLERLTRKIEVARKLYQSYQPDLSKPSSQTPVRSAFALYLTVFYFHAGLVLGDWKWINTGVKMTEGILLVPALDIPAAIREMISRVEGMATP